VDGTDVSGVVGATRKFELMAVYWFLFTLPTLILFSPYRLSASVQKLAWSLVAIIFAATIGFRHEVGGDWFAYEAQFDFVARLDFVNALEFSDPGYYGLGWLVSQWGGNIYLLNAICAVIVMSGVVVFARAQPKPWLAVLVAVPYLIIVVAMGYTRQSAALGLAMIGLAALGQQQVLKFVIWVLLGAVFHKSAMLLLPFAALAASQRRLWTWTWVAITTTAGVYLLLAEQSNVLWQNYVVAEYESQGGLIRVLMNAIPAVLFLLFRRRLHTQTKERKLWFWLSVFSLACVPLVIISSTATDRVSLYFIPIQMYVLSRLHRLATTSWGRAFIVNSIAVYCAMVLYVWLNFAVHAAAWVPYHFMPL
jgi:hypothetical protein